MGGSVHKEKMLGSGLSGIERGGSNPWSCQGETPPDANGEGLPVEELSVHGEGFLAIMCTVCIFLWQGEKKMERVQSGVITSDAGPTESPSEEALFCPLPLVKRSSPRTASY